MNKLTTKTFSIGIGTIGMIGIIAGTFLQPTVTQKLCFLLGGLLMLVSSIIERHKFLTVLQIVTVSGASMAFTPFTVGQKMIVPIGLTVLSLIAFAVKGELKDRLTLLGSVGLGCLAVGYATSNPILYFLGGVFLAIYAFASYFKGVKIALLWAILNSVFSVTAGMAAIRYLSH